MKRYLYLYSYLIRFLYFVYFADEERAKVEEAAHETLQQKIDRYNFCSPQIIVSFADIF